MYGRSPSPLPLSDGPVPATASMIHNGQSRPPELVESRSTYRSPTQAGFEHRPTLQTEPSTLSQQRQPVTAPYVPRARTASANSNMTAHSTRSSRRPLPDAPATSAMQNKAQDFLPRPSQDSYASSTHGYFGNGSGIAPPRPSMSSTYSGRSSSGPRDVRPLPIPSEEDESFSMSPADLSGLSAYETASSLSSSRSVQSDFSRDFYAAGSSVPEELRQPSVRKPRKKTSSQPTNFASPHGHVASSASYPEAIQRQASSVPQNQQSRPSTAGTSETSGSYKTDPAGQSFGYSEGLGRSDINTSTSSPIVVPPARPAPVPQPGHSAQVGHAQSDPVTVTRATPSQSHRTAPLPRSNTLNNNLQNGNPTSRSYSFSASEARKPSAQMRKQSSGYSTTFRSGRPSLPEISPPLPSSPSISISHSLGEASANSSYADHSSTSYRSGSVKKQASLAPSGMSGLGYLGSMQRDPDREKRRRARLGLEHLNPALLSNLAQSVKDRVPRALNIKGAVHYPNSFTGEQIITTLAEGLPFPYTDDRRIALSLARTLHRNMFFHEADWEVQHLKDSVEQVFCFEEDEEQSTFDYLNSAVATRGGPNLSTNRIGKPVEDLPTGVITRFTKCYSPFCGTEGSSGACYSLYCPNGSHPVSSD